MKATIIRHCGDVHQIVEGIDLYELNQGNISLELPKEADHFKFTVIGTDHNTGLRQSFKLLIAATLRRSLRSDLDLAYVRRLIKETVEEILARENFFITGGMERGNQFDRAFLYAILSPGRIVSHLTGGRVLAFDGKMHTDDLTPEQAKEKAAGRSFIATMGNGDIFSYSVEDQPKWGYDDFNPASGVMLNTAIERRVVSHFVGQMKNRMVYPVQIHRVSGEQAILTELIKGDVDVKRLSQETGPSLVKAVQPRHTQPVAKKVEVSDEYREALDDLDSLLRKPNVPRAAWKTASHGVGAGR